MKKIDFEIDSSFGKYRDAIVLFNGQTMTDAEIEAMKQERFNRWLDLVSNPPVEEPTGEE